MFFGQVFRKLCAEYAYVFYFLNFLAESTFRDIDTVGDPQNTCFGYNVSSSICGGMKWTFYSRHVSGSNCNWYIVSKIYTKM